MTIFVAQILRKLRDYDLKGPLQAKRLIPGPPRRPESPFLLYFARKQIYYDEELQLLDYSRQERHKQNDKLFKVERNLIIQKAKEEWNAMSTIDKAPYIKQQSELREKYFIDKKRHTEDFRYFRPTSPQAIYRNQMVGADIKRKEGEPTLTQLESRQKFSDLHLMYQQRFATESEQIISLYGTISKFTIMQDTIQQVRQMIYQIPSVFNKSNSKEVWLKMIEQYYEQRRMSNYSFGQFISNYLSAKHFEQYQKQLTRLSKMMGEQPEVIQEIIAYKKAHLHLGEYVMHNALLTASSRFGKRVKTNKFLELVEKTLDMQEKSRDEPQ